MVDPARLGALLERLRDTEHELLRLRELGVESVRSDTDRLNSVKYLFVLAAEVSIDIGQHILAGEGLRIPETFPGVFVELASAGWIEDELATSLGALARFRNLLVHGYATVDDDRVLEILHADSLADLSSFREQVSGRASKS
jgi:uncharacterized protein YutE (UPF0331/DUF86 family)